jgi:hypothetical protein
MNNATFDGSWPNASRSAGERYTSSSSSINDNPASQSTYNSDSSRIAYAEIDNNHSTALMTTLAAEGHVNASSLNANQVAPQHAETPSCEKRPRKGHKKSRAGCYNCKKGKIKVYNSSKIATRLTLESAIVPRESTRML